MKLYELVGCDPKKGFSPFVWRTKLALAHKGLNYETVPVTFTEIKETLAFAGSKTVPVLVDGENVISDSWDIACYLEDTYPDHPSLFGGDTGRAAANLLGIQVGMPVLFPLFRTLVADIHGRLNRIDQDYFRETREPRIDCTIEEAAVDFEGSLKVFQLGLASYNAYLKTSSFFSGEKPAYADYIIYSSFLWAKRTSPKVILDKDDPIAKWLERMDGLFNGLGAKVQLIEKD
ncbi:MAG: glutathione S-transferase family protein [Emcibacteraceae bacterium]|nr:glutathione S-transferase family protein [Emcibacteraceae bacterium]MDG1994987.1 glutathione S-transferase family protein [Emcibacteraceae bacterium]